MRIRWEHEGYNDQHMIAEIGLTETIPWELVQAIEDLGVEVRDQRREVKLRESMSGSEAMEMELP